MMLFNSKNNVIFILLSLFLLLFLLSACSGSFFRGNSESISNPNFQKGEDALIIEFLDDMPPPSLYVGNSFTTGVRVKNAGAFDMVEGAELTISVPDPSAFYFKDGNSKPFFLKGRSLYVKEGDENVLMFPMSALCFPGYTGTRDSIVTNYTRKIKASACYYYETNAKADICIDTRKFLRTSKTAVACTMDAVNLRGGQGGPVGVTSINPIIIPQSEKEVVVQLSIAIDKFKGVDHAIFSPNTGCDVAAEDAINVVAVDVELGSERLQCEPAEVKIKDASAVGTVCRKTFSTDVDAFSTPVNIKLSYYVQQKALKDINVQPPPGGAVVNCASLAGAAS